MIVAEQKRGHSNKPDVPLQPTSSFSHPG